MGKFMLEEQRKEVCFGRLMKMWFCWWWLEISKVELEFSKVELEISEVALEISKTKNYFVGKMKGILEKEDLMHSIPWTCRGTTIKTRWTYSIQRTWLAIMKTVRVLQPLPWIGTLGKKVPIHFMTRAKWWRETSDQCHGRWILQNWKFWNWSKKVAKDVWICSNDCGLHDQPKRRSLRGWQLWTLKLHSITWWVERLSQL